MNQGIERRLRKLEKEYAARLALSRVVAIRFLTEEDISRGLGAGLYKDGSNTSSAGALDHSAGVPDSSSGSFKV